MPNVAQRLVAIAIASVTVSFCGQQPKEDPRVAQLQKELESTKQALADKNAPAAAADAANSAPLTAAKADEPNANQAATDKALSDRSASLAEQNKATARQADENQRLRREVEDMKPRQFTLPAGTLIPARTTAPISTDKVTNGSVFDAVLERDLIIDGTTLARAGALVHCVVIESDRGGRVKGKASLSVAARSIAGVGGNTLTVKTHSFSTEAGSTTKKDTVRGGVATGAGAIVGGIAGGGKGAAIGAGAGAAVGAGAALVTRGAAAVIPTETLIEFPLSAAATVVLRK